MEKQTLGEITAQKLVRMIQEKGYVPGDKLPTEMELSEVLRVGRNTVREALRILMSRNIVTRDPAPSCRRRTASPTIPWDLP